MDISSVRIPFPDLDCAHWLDACEPEDSNAILVEDLEDQSVVLSGEEA